MRVWICRKPMTANSTLPPLEQALTTLRKFICIERIPPDQVPDSATIQQALRQVREHSDYQIFGICADTTVAAIAALHTYLAALDYAERPSPNTTLEGPVYLKFNPKTGLCHLDTYIGNHRGVLVACQSAYDGDVNETFGHLPLDLFEA